MTLYAISKQAIDNMFTEVLAEKTGEQSGDSCTLLRVKSRDSIASTAGYVVRFQAANSETVAYFWWDDIITAVTHYTTTD